MYLINSFRGRCTLPYAYTEEERIVLLFCFMPRLTLFSSFSVLSRALRAPLRAILHTAIISSRTMSRRRYEFRLWSFRSCVLLPTADLDNIAYPVILLEDTTIIFSDISRLVGFSCKIGFAMRAESRHSMRKEPPVTHRVPSNSRSLLTSRALLSYLLLSPPCLLNRAELKNALRYFLNLLIYFEA